MSTSSCLEQIHAAEQCVFKGALLYSLPKLCMTVPDTECVCLLLLYRAYWYCQPCPSSLSRGITHHREPHHSNTEKTNKRVYTVLFVRNYQKKKNVQNILCLPWWVFIIIKCLLWCFLVFSKLGTTRKSKVIVWGGNNPDGLACCNQSCILEVRTGLFKSHSHPLPKEFCTIPTHFGSYYYIFSGGLFGFYLWKHKQISHLNIHDPEQAKAVTDDAWMKMHHSVPCNNHIRNNYVVN